nr:Homocysteine S-methyltransferase [Candidatus Pantoea persica]
MQHDSLVQALTENDTLILDGALATELEARGCNLAESLWSAKALMENPELIYQVHYDYFAAGARVAITASYQATPQGFAARELDEAQSLALIARSVELVRCARRLSCRERQPGDAAGVRNPAVVCRGAGAGRAADRVPGRAGVVLFTLRDSEHISDGTPLVVYPHSGEQYDATSKTGHSAPLGCTLHDQLPAWRGAGARLIRWLLPHHAGGDRAALSTAIKPKKEAMLSRLTG